MDKAAEAVRRGTAVCRQPRARQTRERLLQAMGCLLAQGPLHALSLDDIAAQAELTRGALYWHFQDKEALFRAWLASQALPLEQLAPGAEPALVPLAAAMARTLCEPAPALLWQVMLREQNHPAVRRRLLRLRALLLRQAQALLDLPLGRPPREGPQAQALLAMQATIGGLLLISRHRHSPSHEAALIEQHLAQTRRAARRWLQPTTAAPSAAAPCPSLSDEPPPGLVAAPSSMPRS